MLLPLTLVVTAGCEQPKAKVTVADVRRIFTENSGALSELAAMLEADAQVIDIDPGGVFREPVSLSRQKQYLKLLRDANLPILHVFCDRSDAQLTANVLIDGWNNARLVYTNGTKPKELVLTCIECPTQSFEPISGSWFVGIIDESDKEKAAGSIP